MTDRPVLTDEHFLDALALCRATLCNDEQALMTIAEHTPNIGMLLQALVRLHLQTLTVMAEGDPQVVNEFLSNSLQVLSGRVEPPC